MMVNKLVTCTSGCAGGAVIFGSNNGKLALGGELERRLHYGRVGRVSEDGAEAVKLGGVG